MKGETFGDMYPEGTCVLCKAICECGAIFHEHCALAYENKRKERLDNGKCPVCSKELPLGLRG